ncbi:MAG: hypothetical protein ABIH71_03915 [Candidatus Omnitrophota bacterium]|nr:hypothetical protein [Candidatus Omnitrophota bacterium]
MSRLPVVSGKKAIKAASGRLGYKKRGQVCNHNIFIKGVKSRLDYMQVAVDNIKDANGMLFCDNGNDYNESKKRDIRNSIRTFAP